MERVEKFSLTPRHIAFHRTLERNLFCSAGRAKLSCPRSPYEVNVGKGPHFKGALSPCAMHEPLPTLTS
jgi:hypothetical protein